MAGVFLGDDEVIPEDDLFDPEVEEIIELAASRIRGLAHRNKKGRGGVRYVRTPEGARFYGQPIGSPITADIIAAAERRNGKRAPKTALAYEPPAKRPTSARGPARTPLEITGQRGLTLLRPLSPPVSRRIRMPLPVRLRPLGIPTRDPLSLPGLRSLLPRTTIRTRLNT